MRILNFKHNPIAVFLWALPFLVIAGLSTAATAWFQWKLNGKIGYAIILAIGWVVLIMGIRYIQRRFK